MKHYLAIAFLLFIVLTQLVGCVATPPSASASGNQPPQPTSTPSTARPADCQPPPRDYARKRYINSIGMEFVLIPAGCFRMGVDYAQGVVGEESSHWVRITKAFWLQTTEVTQEQWNRIMGANPSGFRGKTLPVEHVSWDDAQGFIAKLNAKEKANYRLPTEAEWEYACRGGKEGEFFCGGSNPDAVAWHKGNSDSRIHPVAGKQANGLGLYDMSGNVLEWCSDWYSASYYQESPRENPPGPKSGSYRVIRGGDWVLHLSELRAASRLYIEPYRLGSNLGFRLAMPSGK